MLHSCYGILSRAARAWHAFLSCQEKYLLATASPMPSTPIALVPTESSSLIWTSLLPPSPSFNSSHPLYLHLMHAAASQQRIYNKGGKYLQVFNGSALKFQRSCGRMFASRASRVDQQKIVVVVESPAKAKAIQRFLGTDFVVLPSHGPVRDLAARAGSVRPDEDFAMLWEVPEAAQSHVARIKNACKSAQRLIVATDPDREGEALAWHVFKLIKAEGLMKNVRPRVRRVLFSEVTKGAVLHAMQAPEQLRLALVDAHVAGRALDYLVGFSLSPLLWRKLAGSPSAGRVHLAALQLVCEREKAIKEFVPQVLWTLDVSACIADESVSFSLTPILIDGSHKAECLVFAEKLKDSTLKVSKVTKSFKQRDPPEPYTTATLQEDAEALLGFAAEHTMTLAQKLYEGVNLGKGEWTGLITYPRTSGLQLSKEAARKIRAIIAQRFGIEHTSLNARNVGSNTENTGEINEALRPTNMQRAPSLCQMLDKDALALYTLIWKRTLECQMQPAMYEEVSVDFVTEAEAVCLRANVSHLTFPGFLAASTDKEMSASLKASSLVNPDYKNLASESWDRVSALKEGDEVLVKKAAAQKNFTPAPVRFSEGLLVKAMAEAGIGRPSTYASILKSLKAKKYVKYENQQIAPEVQGLMVSFFLSHYLPKFAVGNMIGLLEKQLDEVSGGRMQWKQVLREFWPAFTAEVSSAIDEPNDKVVEVLNEALFVKCSTDLGIKGRSCPRCKTGKLLLKEKRFARTYYIGCNGYPMCSFKAQVMDNENANTQAGLHLNLSEKPRDILLGIDPITNLEVMVRTGPWGSYIQLGKAEKGLECFKLPHGVDRDNITMEQALRLMKYPRELGKHPEDGLAVILGLNDRSYFVKHRAIRAEVPQNENVEVITLERALHILESGRKACGRHAANEKEDMKFVRNNKVGKEKKGKKEVVEKVVKPRGRKKTRLEAGKEAEKHVVAGTRVTKVSGRKKARFEAGKEGEMQAVAGTRVKSSRGMKNTRFEAGKEAEKPAAAGIRVKKARFEAGKEAEKHVAAGIRADGEPDATKEEDTASQDCVNGLYASAQ